MVRGGPEVGRSGPPSIRQLLEGLAAVRAELLLHLTEDTVEPWPAGAVAFDDPVLRQLALTRATGVDVLIVPRPRAGPRPGLRSRRRPA